MDYDGDARNSSSPEEKNPKRRMKSRFQLEALERVYAEDRYPTEAVRAELSLHLNLSDKQLQMWFCHRRLKDRKGEDDESGQGGAAAARKKAKTDRSAPAFEGHHQQGPVLETYNLLDPPGNRNRTDASHDEFEFDEENYRGMMHGGSSGAHFRKSVSVHEAEMFPPKRSHLQGGRVPSPRIAAEIAAVAAVEARLGKHLRSDGPPLGVHFDPLPSPPLQDFLGVEKKLPAAVPQQHYVEKPPVERQDVRPSKVGGFGLPPLPTAAVMTPKGIGLPVQQNVNAQHLSRPPREFQFLPDHHSSKGDAYRKSIPFNLHSNTGKPYDLLPDTRVRSLSPLRSFLPSSNMPLTLGDGYCLPRERVQNVAISLALPGQGRSSGMYTPLGIDTEIQQPGLYHNFELGGQNGVCQSALQGIGSSQPPFGGSDSLALFQEQERVRAEKKRKIEEMKVARESEANMKRIKRDLERQEIVRRKKEEQMKRDAEKLDREKKKEEERILREKQREEERLEREQKREQGRQEKMVLKENRKMEKQLRKEELRKSKEAARLKALSEKAAAKKLTKESMDTIDDEQLELLEAATAQGLLSGNGLEDGDRQDMDFSNVVLKEFPPMVVRMKVPMSGYPWAELDHTVGDFFMVWRFLTTFADVIGLWSFTLDEFAQALYDHDPRLLGEIHVSLIKMLVKNIEDAAQAAASGAVGSQNAIALASGGHPQIVEAAFEWGFDIREWGHYVNPVTWPEVLRQFALAAGYGPKWRTTDKEAPPVKEEVEERSEENAVKVLRSGAAAASAVALMQGKGVGNLRRGRYRLTPGTVKYAAFHILSLEGAKGLTILDVAEKIQKSGLRDLSTSKTPEASIAAALSRDMNLFERVAPSTYCVRPAFRKDLDDTEEVLQSARERIRLFQSGFLDVEEAEKETDEAEDVERDEDYDSDGQDVEDGDLAAQLSKDADVKDEILAKQALHSATEEGMEIDESQVGEPWVQGLMEGDYSDLSVEERLMALVALVNVVNEGHGIRQALETRMEAASALKRQLWTETQLERRRHKEEQLSRLQPALLAAKNEVGDLSLATGAGPSPIVTPEKPCEPVAKAKDENSLDLSLVLIDPPPDIMSTVEQSLLQEKVLPTEEKGIIFQEGLGPQESVAAGLITERPRVQLKANTEIQAEELYLIRSFPLGLDRRRNRFWQFSTCTGGQDPSLGRIYFESSSDGHWGVVDNEESLDALMTALDVRGTREAGLHAVLGRLESSLRLAMRAAASSRSFRESGTDAASEAVGPGRDLDSVGGSDGSGVMHSTALGSSPPRGLGLKFLEEPGAIVVNLGKTDADKRGLFQHFKDFEQWMWSEQSRTLSGWRVAKPGRKREPDLLSLCVKCHDLYWTSEKYCQFCYSSNPKTQGKQDLRARESDERMKRDPSTLVPPRVQILKADIVSIEALLPLDAFKDPWDQQHRKAWALSVKSAREPHELLQAVTELEIRVKPDWLSSYYSNKEALSARASSKLTTNSQGQPWLPHTSAAVGLHVLAFGAALACSTEEKKKKQKAEEEEQDPSIGVPASQSTSDSPATDDQINEEDGGTSKDVTETRGGRGRGRGGRKGLGGIRSSRTSGGRGGAKKGSKSKPVQEERTVAVTTTEVKQGAKGGGRGQGGRSRSLSRGRPRGRSTGRARGRGSRGGRSHLSAGRKDKAPKEKNPNELHSGEATLVKALEQPPAREEEDEGVSKSEWEESEDKSEEPQEMEEDENTGGLVEDDGDENVHVDEAEGDVEVLPEASDAEEEEEDEEQQEEADAEEEENQEEADGDEEEHPEEEADVDEEEHQEEADGDEEELEAEADGNEEDHQEEADGDEDELTAEGDGDEEELATEGDGDEEELPTEGDGDEEEFPTEGDRDEEELPSMAEGDDLELTQEAYLDDEEAAEELGEGADEDGGADEMDEEDANRAEKGDDEEVGGSQPP